ncbi:MAG: hypothetical protein ACE10C_10170, partial [Candidatus Binatia bacterium]
LIPAVGMRATVTIAATLNVLIALVIFAVDRARDKGSAFNRTNDDPFSLKKTLLRPFLPWAEFSSSPSACLDLLRWSMKIVGLAP